MYERECRDIVRGRIEREGGRRGWRESETDCERKGEIEGREAREISRDKWGESRRERERGGRCRIEREEI
jgi:hypothetical protein